MCRRFARIVFVAVAVLAAASGAFALDPADGSAAALRAKRGELQAALRDNAFGEPLVIVSKEMPDRIDGEVYAELPFGFEVVTAAFRTPAAVCELLFLHLNVHGCVPREASLLEVLAGPKKSGGAGMTAQMRYTMRTEVDAADHLRVVLSAPTGPLSTTDYRMVFEAVPIDEQRSFVHFGYAHGAGLLARMAMQTYLATAGRDKIGFSITGRDAEGRPQYVRGERGSLERNVMRYYLALLTHCRERAGSADERQQARLRTWFALTERHAAQLHEYSLDEYLGEKRRDLARMSAQK
jgi:hypothetical protein